MEIINLTPHTVVVAPDVRDVDTPQPSTTTKYLSCGVARVAFRPPRCIGNIAPNVPVYEMVTEAVDITGLPDESRDTIYIVSRMVMEALPLRTDLVCPDSGPTAKRDDQGHIVSVERLLGRFS